MMKIAIVGAGAMGCLYGGMLSDAGNEVWLLDVMEEHVRAIRENGLSVQEKGLRDEVIEKVFGSLKATTDPTEIGVAELALIFVKSTATRDAVEANSIVFGPETVALTLQNGMGNIEAIASVIGDRNVIAGTTAHGATMLGPGHIRHAGIGRTVLGELSGIRTQRISEIADVFRLAGFETEITENVMGLIWDKLLVNVGINALTAITGQQNGRLVEYPELEAIMEKAVEEGRKVAEAAGISLGHADPFSHVREVCLATAENRSSMLQDVQNKRKTEIDMINGAVVTAGKQAGVATPVNEILTDLVRFMERAAFKGGTL